MKESLKAEVLKILSINQIADSFVNATYQLSRNVKDNWMGIYDAGSTLYLEAKGRKQVENIPSVWLITQLPEFVSAEKNSELSQWQWKLG